MTCQRTGKESHPPTTWVTGTQVLVLAVDSGTALWFRAHHSQLLDESRLFCPGFCWEQPVRDGATNCGPPGSLQRSFNSISSSLSCTMRSVLAVLPLEDTHYAPARFTTSSPLQILKWPCHPVHTLPNTVSGHNRLRSRQVEQVPICAPGASLLPSVWAQVLTQPCLTLAQGQAFLPGNQPSNKAEALQTYREPLPQADW